MTQKLGVIIDQLLRDGATFHADWRLLLRYFQGITVRGLLGFHTPNPCCLAERFACKYWSLVAAQPLRYWG